MSTVRLSTGHYLELGQELAEGGEGRIHEVKGLGNRLAKIYHRTVDENRFRKLVVMVQLRTHDLESVAAWPIDIIHDGAGRCAGFVMPRVTGPGIIDRLSHPAEQRIAFPTVDYAFLLHVAMNLMRAAATLHASKCVIGDVNESNVYILSDGTVRFIDVDSFQVEHCGQVFPCNVGTPIFTPPELQGVTFRGTVRTPAHDSFGLAVLVFQLLMQGCHPFAGVPRDGRSRTIEESIKDGLYAYSSTQAHRVRPPPDRLAVRSLGEIADLFERSFLSKQRPSAAEWMRGLDRARGRLRRCGRNPRHNFLHEATTCPLCALPRDPLPHFSGDAAPPIDLGGLSIGELIRQAGQVPPFRPVLARCGEPNLLAYERSIPTAPRSLPQPSPQVSQPSGSSGTATAGGWILVIGIVLIFVFPPAGIGSVILGAILLSMANSQAKAEVERRTEAAAKAAADLKQRQDAAMLVFEPRRREAQAALDRLISVESKALAADRSAAAVLGPLTKAIWDARAWLTNADNRLASELRGADDTYRRQRLTEHLERQIITHASIPDIGPSRKAMLASFGVETAADVDRHAIQRISGFGPHLTDRLISWRRKCEQAFSQRGVLRAPSEWLDRIRQQHNAAVAANATRLRGALREYHSVHSAKERQLSVMAIELDHARRECRTALNSVKLA